MKNLPVSVIQLVFFLSFFNIIIAKERVFYVAAVELDWDYAPSGINLLNGNILTQDEDAEVFTKQGNNTIGKVYKKALFREFTDDTYTVKKPRESFLGILGPILQGETGDQLVIHFKNLATKRKYSMHPHGVFYTKAHEGALYVDKTAGADKKDDGVEPGQSFTYLWEVKQTNEPTTGDSDCLTWIYHSHVEPSKDTNSGLIGPMIICKKGALPTLGHRQLVVKKQITLLFSIFDENDSWYLDDNIQTFCSAPSPDIKDDEGFQESNKMHSINGYLYGNLPGLEMCQGDHVDWHMFGMGSELDLHTAYFHGQTIKIDNHRRDVASILPARFLTAHMIPHNPGTWLLNCVVNDHYAAGMFAMFKVNTCGKEPAAPASGGKLREYFIAAEEIIWDYGPTGMDHFFGGNLTAPESDSEVFFARGKHSIGGQYKKALYIEYTDATFSTTKNRSLHQQHLGFLGPVIRAEVGDQIRVVFKNKASYNYSIQPHGVFYNKSNEGALYDDNSTMSQTKDDSVQPGATYVYSWSVPEYVGPTDSDTNCVTSLYSSAVNPIKDTYSGLIGPLLVCKKNTLDQYGEQKNIDKEFILMFMVSNENLAWYIDDNVQNFCSDPSGYEADDNLESNLMHGINGLLYANLEGLSMCKGDSVSWHLIGMGNEVDMHGAHFHGQTFITNNQRKDVVSLLPGTFSTALMKPDNVGEWAVVCRTNDHFSAGMVAKFNVSKCSGNDGSPTELKGKTRTFFIAAVEMEWDYAPSGKDMKKDMDLNDPLSEGYVYVFQGNTSIGRKYKKILYREFEGYSFTKQKPHPEYLGMLGPIIRAEVGDVIKLVFKNKASAHNFGVHPHGVLFNKKNEGALYEDGTTNADKSDERIGPGHTYTYTWEVPERSGPSPTDMNCVTWAYYSAVDPIKDTSSGLIGPLVICRKGTLDENGLRKDVQKEFPLLFTVTDENNSWCLDDNIKNYCNKPADVDEEDENFQTSNKMQGINGLVFGNLNGLTMEQDDKVAWYLMGMGTESDMHTVHFHGQTFLQRTGVVHREDVLELFPGLFETVEMQADNVGVWLLHCHVNNHMTKGMSTTFEVTGKSKPTPKSQGLVNMPTTGFVLCSFLSLVIVVLM